MVNHPLSPWYQNEAIVHYARLCQTLQWQHVDVVTHQRLSALALIAESTPLSTLQNARHDMDWSDSLTQSTQTQTFDFVLVDMTAQFYQHQAELNTLLIDWKRLLKPQGVLGVFALGMYSLLEVLAIQRLAAQPKIIDMHDLGNALMQAGFADPVVERVDALLNFANAKRMVEQYEMMGLRFQDIVQKQQVLDALQKTTLLQFNCEVVIAHAFLGEPKAATGSAISLESLKAQLRK